MVAENGLTQIISLLDKIYQEDSAQLSYRVYSKFEKYSRPESTSLQSYLSEFKKLISDLKKQKITLPEEVLAYRFLNSANLPAEKTDLALATVKSLTYKEMCVTVEKIFSVRTNLSGIESSSVKVEPEECNYTNSSSRRGFDHCKRFRGTGQSNHCARVMVPFFKRARKKKGAIAWAQ